MSARRWISGAFAVAAAVLLASAAAWACVSGPTVHFSTTSAKPGDSIAVTGSGFSQKGLVTVRWNALTGPVLSTMHAPAADGAAMGTFTVPADAQTGTYVVIFTQSASDGTLSQVPIRGVVSVSGNGSTAPVAISPAGAGRVDGLVSSHSAVPTSSLVLTALGVAGAAIFLAGLGVFFVSRRGGAPETVKTGR